jgi:MATE family multidrug resistance protein
MWSHWSMPMPGCSPGRCCPRCGLPPCANYITALAHSAVIGWITVAALGLNLALNYTLVFGRFGFPALGVVGAGIGTTVVTWCMFATLALHVSRSARFQARRPRLLTRRVDRRLFAGIFRLGIPVALTQILNGGMFSMAAVLVGMLSATTLAAQQILYSVIYLALSAAAGFADAVRVRVAYGVGRGSLKAVRMSARLAFMMAALTTLAATSLVWLAPEALVSVFLEGGEADNQLVLETALALSGAAGLFLLLDGTQLVIANTIRGLRDTRSPCGYPWPATGWSAWAPGSSSASPSATAPTACGGDWWPASCCATCCSTGGFGSTLHRGCRRRHHERCSYPG